MDTFKSLVVPRDIRWQGPQSFHHKIFLAKNILLIFIFIPLVIAEGVLFQKWWADMNFKNNGEGYTPYWFWLRIGMALIPDLIVSIINIFLILNPLSRATLSLHPIWALITSFILFALYANCAWLNWLIPYSNEVNFDRRDTWEGICLGELVVESVFALAWFAMFVLSCVATRRWNLGRRGKGGEQGVKMRKVSGEERV